MGKAKQAMEAMHLFSKLNLNFRSEEKRLRQMGATDDDFYEVLIDLVIAVIVGVRQSEKNAVRDAKIYLDYRFFTLPEAHSFKEVGSWFNLSAARSRQIIFRIDRFLRHDWIIGRFKSDLYSQVLAKVLDRQ